MLGICRSKRVSDFGRIPFFIFESGAERVVCAFGAGFRATVDVTAAYIGRTLRRLVEGADYPRGWGIGCGVDPGQILRSGGRRIGLPEWMVDRMGCGPGATFRRLAEGAGRPNGVGAGW